VGLTTFMGSTGRNVYTNSGQARRAEMDRIPVRGGTASVRVSGKPLEAYRDGTSHTILFHISGCDNRLSFATVRTVWDSLP